jgi:hypothetical protein
VNQKQSEAELSIIDEERRSSTQLWVHQAFLSGQHWHVQIAPGRLNAFARFRPIIEFQYSRSREIHIHLRCTHNSTVRYKIPFLAVGGRSSSRQKTSRSPSRTSLPPRAPLIYLHALRGAIARSSQVADTDASLGRH